MKPLRLLMLTVLVTILAGSYSLLLAVDFEDLAYHWAPMIYQDVDTKWETGNSGWAENGVDDFITRFNYDGENDFIGDNNWENLTKFETTGLPAFVYYSVAETQTHWFIFYAIYHPRDWDDEQTEKLSGPLQHENDMEGLMLVVKDDGTEFGSVQIVNTFAHNHWFNYPVPGSNIKVKHGFDDDRIDESSRPKFTNDSHVIVYVQSEGHGVYADKIKKWTEFWEFDSWFDSWVFTEWSQADIDYWEETRWFDLIYGFPNKTGVRYIPGPKAGTAMPIEEGGGRYDQVVIYELLDINELWSRRDDDSTFADAPNGRRFSGTNDGYLDIFDFNNVENDNLCSAPWALADKKWLLSKQYLSPPGQTFSNPAAFIWHRYEGFGVDAREFMKYTPNNPPWIVPSRDLIVDIASIDPSDFPEIKLYTTVEDPFDNSLLGLTPSHFKVYEDQTSESPISVTSVGASFVGTSVCIVMDTSGSMEYAIRDAKQAAISFVSNLKPEDKAALIRFREYVTIEQPYTDDRDALITAIGSLYADGGTAFYDAVYKGVAMASTQPGIRAIIALTDGLDNESVKTAKEIIDYAKYVSVPVYIVGLGSDIDEPVLQLIADGTEGQYKRAPGSEELLDLYEDISEKLRNLYEVSYTTHNPDRDGTIRSVDVKVVDGGASGQDSMLYTVPGLEGAIAGVVLNGETGEPIQSASILVEHETQYFRITDASMTTNENGEYQVGNLSPNFKYRVTAYAMNYNKVVYPGSVSVRATETTEDINFELQPVDEYLAAKQALIRELRDDEEIYEEEEDRAEQFLRNIERKGIPLAEQDEETLRRLYIVESFSKEAYTDSKRLAQLGTDGLGGFIDIGMATIAACGGVGEALKKIPFVGNFLASPYIAAKNEMVNHMAVKSHIFLYQNYNVPWTLKGDLILREAIGNAYEEILVFASNEVIEKDFSDAMAEVHKFIEKRFFLGIYELTTAGFMDQSVEWAENDTPVFRVGGLPSAEARVNQLLYSMNSLNEERIRNAEILIWTGDTIGTAGAVASGVALAGGAVLAAVSAKTVVGAPLAAVLIPLSTKIAIATSTAAGGLKLGTTAGIAVDLWSTLPNYVKEATAYSFDMPSSALAAPTLIAVQGGELHSMNEVTSSASVGRSAPSRRSPALMPLNVQYTVDDYNALLGDVYEYILDDEPEKVQEALGTLTEYGSSLLGDINVSTAQILAASPRALYQVSDYDAIYSKFETDLSRATSERINLYTLLALYLADPGDTSIKDLITMQIGKTTDTNNELDETLTSTTQTLNEANIAIPTLVIIKNFSTPDVIPRGEPFTVSAIVKNIGQMTASEVNVELAVPRSSRLIVLQRGAKYLDVLGPGEEYEISWELEYGGSYSAIGGGVNLVTISVDADSEFPDFDHLPSTYVFIPAPPPTPPTGGQLSNMNVYAYPNPYNPMTGSVNIRYSLNKDTNVTIEVYDASGELVTTIISGEPKDELVEYSESWDGRNDQGDTVANGVYFYLITTTTDEKAAGKIAVLR